MQELLLAILALVVLVLLLLAGVLTLTLARMVADWRFASVALKAGRQDMQVAVTQAADASKRQTAGKILRV